jgi:Cft2 family RNA processing exonuclease
MRMFVWEYVDGITCNWHDGGGVVVIAKDVDRARELLMATDGVSRTEFTDEPDFSTSVGTRKEKVFIFPDAGCC